MTETSQGPDAFECALHAPDGFLSMFAMDRRAQDRSADHKKNNPGALQRVSSDKFFIIDPVMENEEAWTFSDPHRSHDDISK
nr:hypothetical protein CFP56_16834 [Quercus suber]